MRVVGGAARGRRLQAPGGRGVRPTADRVREAVFDVLMSLGALEDATVVDLFAGTGALGIEALSRGASAATLVERDQAAVAAIRSNLDATGLAGRGRAVRAEALSWLARQSTTFDVAFCDPPYGFAAWGELLAALPARLAVLESAAPIGQTPGWQELKERRYGTTLVRFVYPLPSLGKHDCVAKGGS